MSIQPTGVQAEGENTDEFNWELQTAADQLLRELLEDFCRVSEFASALRSRMLTETGTRLVDWVDHLAVRQSLEVSGQLIAERLEGVGFEFDAENEAGKWYVHHGGLFPPICLSPSDDSSSELRLAIEVDSVSDFLAAHRLEGVVIEGRRSGQMRRAKIDVCEGAEFWVCERQGFTSWAVPYSTEPKVIAAIEHFERFLHRPRNTENSTDAFPAAKKLCADCITDLGTDWACELFFAAERDYWQRRNHAARVQKARQDRLGLGWGNHDHHTYRSSRRHFADLIAVLELLGFQCRERFYAGEEAGWGAQVLEQPGCGIVIFADVDLTAKELEFDFGHLGLSEKSELGTVGVWCALHGDSFSQAGMHHLECTFDFDEARRQLEAVGVVSMVPFTDKDHLRQAFTIGENWTIDPKRIQVAVTSGYISQTEADKFLTDGGIGSHLEILERNDGYKGFNQTGVSKIILKTDPRNANASVS